MFLDMNIFDNGCVPRGRGRGLGLNCFCWACKWSLIEAKNQNSFKFYFIKPCVLLTIKFLASL